MIEGYKLIQIPNIQDERGSLSFIEIGEILNFPINRACWLYDLKLNRGEHAHKALKQFIFCASGVIDFVLDDGNDREIVTLDSPNKGLIIEKPLWSELTNFRNNPTVIVLASDPYDENDYIRSYEEFKRWKYNP